MKRDSLTSFSKEELIALIEALTKQIGVLTKRVEALEAELGKPPKTPDNSSVPPSQGHKANGESETKPKAKSHAGAHRPLHPNPTRRRDVLTDRCEHCRADVSAVPQAAVHAYDRIEIPEIVPDVTRVTLHGGVCPCCRRRFRAAPPAGLAPGSPFGPNLRAFVLYLRFAQAIPFERLARLMSGLLGLEISEGALANMLEASGSAFAPDEPDPRPAVIRHRLAIRRDERARRQQDMVDLGLPQRRQRLLPHPAKPGQGSGRRVPRHDAPGFLGIGSARRADGLGADRPPSLPRSSPA